MAAGAGKPSVLVFPGSPVSYTVFSGSSNTNYKWASEDGTAAGLAPMYIWSTGYLSYNDGSELITFLEQALAESRPLNVQYNFQATIKADAPIAGVIVCVIKTPTLDTRGDNEIKVTLTTTGTVGEYTANVPTKFHEAVNPFIGDGFTFRINTVAPVDAEISFDVTMSGTLGSNVSTAENGAWNSF